MNWHNRNGWVICWLVMGDFHDLDPSVIIASLAMVYDIMLHMQVAMWIHCYIYWYCKWLLYLLALQILLFKLLVLQLVV